MMSADMDTIETALMWLDLGIACIPILAGSKKPALVSWKEFQTVLPRESQLRAWFSNPGYNIAVITGWRGLVVVDFDDWKKHDDWAYSFASQSPMEWIIRNTYYVDTPRGGAHYYFFIDKPAKCLALGGVDIKAQGGYVLTPPSQGYSTEEIPSQIQHVSSVEDLYLPGYTAAMAPKGRPPYDPFEEAMRPWTPGNGASVEDIKARWSVAKVLGVLIADGLQLRPTWHTICPLHADTNPSLAVYPNGSWFCFGCQAGGDVIDLYAALHGVDNGEAIRRMSNE